MRFFVAAISKELAVKALADEPALHIDEGRHNGIDGSGRHFLAELFKAQHAICHDRSPCSVILLRPG